MTSSPITKYVIVNPVVVRAETAPPAREYWVKHHDHERIVAELKAKIEDLEEQALFADCQDIKGMC